MLPAETALLGSAVGFYFGSNQRQMITICSGDRRARQPACYTDYGASHDRAGSAVTARNSSPVYSDRPGRRSAIACSRRRRRSRLRWSKTSGSRSRSRRRERGSTSASSASASPDLAFPFIRLHLDSSSTSRHRRPQRPARCLMVPPGPISRLELTGNLRRLGFAGPIAGTRHASRKSRPPRSPDQSTAMRHQRRASNSRPSGGRSLSRGVGGLMNDRFTQG